MATGFLASTEASPSADAVLRALVVEDDADSRANLVDILELDGFAVDSAASARDVFGRTDLTEFALIILDRRLPDATAETLLPRLRHLAPDAAVICVTGFADIAGVVGAMREGASDYIFKPINVELLRASVARVVERKRLHYAMRRSESAQRTLTEAVPCIVLSLRRDGSIAYFNDFAASLTGYRLADVVGKHFDDLLEPIVTSPGEKSPSPYDPVADEHRRDAEVAIRCANGSMRWTIWNWTTLEDAESEPMLLGVAQDISARKAADERALQNERLAAIGQTMAGLIHESRNALQRSKACLEMLAFEIKNNPAGLKLLSRVQSAQDSLHQLFEEVRQYAAPLRVDARRCDLPTIWRQAWEHLADARQGTTVRLNERTPEAGLECSVDPFKIEQVFRNVFENAIQASPPDGEIIVEASEKVLDGVATLELVCRDQGPGLSLEQQQRVFEPFFTTKTKGTGLGLAICQRIVLAHGGRISVGGNGEEIIICLPRGNV